MCRRAALARDNDQPAAPGPEEDKCKEMLGTCPGVHFVQPPNDPAVSLTPQTVNNRTT